MVFKAILTESDVKRLAAEFKRALKKGGITKCVIILFGSYARGKPHPWSDVDFCVVSPRFGRNVYDDTVRLARLCKKVSYLIEAHPVNPRDLRLGLHPLADEIKRTGKKL